MRRGQLINLAQSGNATTFITLTVNPAIGYSPEGRARALVDAWRKVVKLACKKYGYSSIPYFCVFEATEKGEPHLHILCRVRWIDQHWLSRTMKKLTGAPITDIRSVKGNKHVKFYITKYVGKAPHRFATSKRYWTTRSWAITPEVVVEPNDFWLDDWYIVNRPLWMLERGWRSQGFDIAKEGHMLIAMCEPETVRLGGA